MLSQQWHSWISHEFSVSAVAVRDLGLRNAKDGEIFFRRQNKPTLSS